MAYLSSAEQQEARNQRIFDLQQAAKKRAQTDRDQRVLADPGRTNQWEVAAARDRQNYARQQAEAEAERQQAMNILKQQGLNDAEKERIHAGGLRDQGMNAAKFNAEASKFAAQQQAETAKYGADKQFEGVKADKGYFKADGTYVPGSAVTIAEKQAAAEAEKARLERERRDAEAAKDRELRKEIATAQIAGRQTVAETNGKATVSAADARAAAAEQRAFEVWQTAKLDPLKNSAKDIETFKLLPVEQQKDLWRKSVGRQ